MYNTRDSFYFRKGKQMFSDKAHKANFPIALTSSLTNSMSILYLASGVSIILYLRTGNAL
jgi:hypothetical protein